MEHLDACPVCGSPEMHHDFTGTCGRRNDGSSWPVYRCARCNLGFVNPQPTWAELQSYYDAAYEPYELEHGVEGFAETVARAKRDGEFRHIQIEPGLRILDVGCGGGAFLRVASELDAIVQGVEPSPHGAEAARNQGLPVFNGQLEDFAKAAGAETRFDVITANHVLEHHSDPVALLKTMTTLLSENGYLWLAVPNTGSWSARKLRQRWHSVDLPYHIMQFDEPSMRETLHRAGLRIQRLYTYSLPSALEASIALYLRLKLFVPQRLSLGSIPLRRLTELKAKQMDANGDGEALIVEARPD